MGASCDHSAIQVKYLKTKLDKDGWRIITHDCFSSITDSLQMLPWGVDSVPVVPKDVFTHLTAVYVPTTVDGESAIGGYYLVPAYTLAQPGEMRLFSTDANGTLSQYVWLKNNGTMEIGGDDDWMVRYSKLEEAFNELKGKFNDLVSAFNSHQHKDSLNAPTTTNTHPGTASAADITQAKIVEIKTKGV